jgi:exonuclease SbcD
MKILHTSDWHIGRTLYGRKRYDEFEAFLTCLAETIQQNEIDALLVAGNVFDTSATSNLCSLLSFSTQLLPICLLPQYIHTRI